jgi:hypothetical protein
MAPPSYSTRPVAYERLAPGGTHYLPRTMHTDPPPVRQYALPPGAYANFLGQPQQPQQPQQHPQQGHLSTEATPIHRAKGEPDGPLPYRLPDELGVALGFPSQEPSVPTLGKCEVEGDAVTVRASGVPRWRLELKAAEWGMPLDAICDRGYAVFRLAGAAERDLSVRVCKVMSDGVFGGFTPWAKIEPSTPTTMGGETPAEAPPPSPPPSAPSEASIDASPMPTSPNGSSAGGYERMTMIGSGIMQEALPSKLAPGSERAAAMKTTKDVMDETAEAAAARLQAAERGRRTRLEAKAVRRRGLLSVEEGAEMAFGRTSAAVDTVVDTSLEAWATDCAFDTLVLRALLPAVGGGVGARGGDDGSGRGPITVEELASLGAEEIERRLAAAGLAGLATHVLRALPARE